MGNLLTEFKESHMKSHVFLNDTHATEDSICTF